MVSGCTFGLRAAFHGTKVRRDAIAAPALERRVTTTVLTLSTPVVLSKYPASIISSACLLEISQASQASTITNVNIVTASTSTVTVISTTTATATFSATPTSFYLAISSSDGAYTNNELAIPDTDSNDDESAIIVASSGGLSPTLSTLTSEGYLKSTESGHRAGEQDGSESPYGAVFFWNLTGSEDYGFTEMTCSLDCTLTLTCSVQGNIIFSYCSEEDDTDEEEQACLLELRLYLAVRR